jgi:translation initiation factor 3 subunit H
VLKIVKHCTDNLPTMVAGSLLGLDIDGILEVTYSYPFPARRLDGDGEDGVEDIDGQEYQIEMMKMLRDINVDNNCVGWYQSMYSGTSRTSEIVNNQYIYQSSEDLSDNCVVLLFDPIQTRKGNLVMKAFRLSDEYIRLRRTKGGNNYIKPSEILVELPIKIKNSGHISGFISCLSDSHRNELNYKFDSFSMDNSSASVERHLELMNSLTDDVIQEQQRFQQYTKSTAKARQEQIRWFNSRLQENIERRENGDPELSLSLSELKQYPDAPSRVEPLLMIAQLQQYCNQMNQHSDSTFQKLFVTSKLNSTA